MELSASSSSKNLEVGRFLCGAVWCRQEAVFEGRVKLKVNKYSVQEQGAFIEVHDSLCHLVAVELA